jgi:hypothetical protein
VQKIFIHGSCVTRDGVDWWPEYGFELDGYVARQSLISSQSHIDVQSVEFDFESIASSFAKRMAKGDVTGNLGSQITSLNPDVILWDLCDERSGVIQLPGNGLITGNVVYKSNPIAGRQIALGTEEHFELWKHALDQFVTSVAGIRVIVNATPWALLNDKGEPVNGDSSKPANYNSSIEPYYAEIVKRGLEVIRVDQSKVVARVDHKWGEAPFHYVDGTYREMLVQLKVMLG